MQKVINSHHNSIHSIYFFEEQKQNYVVYKIESNFSKSKIFYNKVIAVQFFEKLKNDMINNSPIAIKKECK